MCLVLDTLFVMSLQSCMSDPPGGASRLAQDKPIDGKTGVCTFETFTPSCYNDEAQRITLQAIEQRETMVFNM